MIDTEPNTDYAYKVAECQRLLAELDGYGDAANQEDGYGTWHERAGSLCMAVRESLHRPMLPRVPVLWYLKITPIPERFKNHGFHIAVNYGLQSDVIHAAYEDWVPADADPWEILSIVRRAQNTISRAIMFGVKISNEKSI